MNTQDKSMFTSTVYGVRIPWTLTPYKPPLSEGDYGIGNTTAEIGGVEYENQQIMDYDGSSFTVRIGVPSPTNPFTHLRVKSLGEGKFYRILNVKTLAAGVSEFTCAFDPIVYLYTPNVFKGLILNGWQTGTINEDDSVLNAVDGMTPIYKTIYKSPEFKNPPRLFVKMKGSMRDFNDLALPVSSSINNDIRGGAAGGTTEFTDLGVKDLQMGGPSNAATGTIFECITDNLNPSNVMAGLAKDLKHTGKVIDAWIDQPIIKNDYDSYKQQLSITLPSRTSAIFTTQSNRPKILKAFEIHAAGDQLNDKARDNKYIRVTVGMTTVDISYNDIFWIADDSKEGFWGAPDDEDDVKKYGYNSMYCSIIYIPATSSQGGMIQVVSSLGDNYLVTEKQEESPYSEYLANRSDLLSKPSRLLASIPLEVVPVGIYGYGWSEYIQRQKFQLADEILFSLTSTIIEFYSKGAIQLSEMTYNIDTSATGKDNTKANQGGISTPTYNPGDVDMTKILTSRTDIVKNPDGTTVTTKSLYSKPKDDDGNKNSDKNQSMTSSSHTSNQSQLDRQTQTISSESKSPSIIKGTRSMKLLEDILKLGKIGMDLTAQWQDALSTPLAGGDSHGVAYFGRVTVSKTVYKYKYAGWTSSKPKYEQDVRNRNLMVLLNNPARTMIPRSFYNLDKFKCKSSLFGSNVYYIEGKFEVWTSSIKNSDNYRLSPQELQMLTDMLKDGFYIGF